MSSGNGQGVTDLGDLVIANGGTSSNSLDFTGWRGGAEHIGITAPGTLTGAVKVQVSLDNSTWFDYQYAGANVAITATGHIVLAFGSTFKYLRVLSGSAEGAPRTFKVTGW